jgi:hypothetical protein
MNNGIASNTKSFMVRSLFDRDCEGGYLPANVGIYKREKNT